MICVGGGGLSIFWACCFGADIAKALTHERHLQIMPGRLPRDFEELVAWVKNAGLASSDGVQPR